MFRKPRTQARIKRDLDLRVEQAITAAYELRCSLAYAVITEVQHNFQSAVTTRLRELGCDLLWSRNSEANPYAL